MASETASIEIQPGKKLSPEQAKADVNYLRTGLLSEGHIAQMLANEVTDESALELNLKALDAGPKDNA
jgi:hypothetical protein